MKLKDAAIYDFYNVITGKTTEKHVDGGIFRGKDDQKIITLNIPAYQRPYRWENENISRLFKDFNEEEKKEYFIGSAILVENIDGDNCTYDVVDGQQRLTTLFLMNYVRYLLKKEVVYNLIKSEEDFLYAQQPFLDLKAMYIDIIGNNNIDIFEEIESFFTKEKLKEYGGDKKKVKKALLDKYEEYLGVNVLRGTKEETAKAVYEANTKFFKNEKLCLRYTRERYNRLLQDALNTVFITKKESSNQFILDYYKHTEEEYNQSEHNVIYFENEDDENQNMGKNYIDALITITESVYDVVDKKKNDSPELLMEKGVEYLNTIIENLSICAIVTEETKDANKLFEVLNNRSYAVDDLELIKNNFYKEYCVKTKEKDEKVIDDTIIKLEEIWVDRVFAKNSTTVNNLISYFAAVYLTQDVKIDGKNEAKFKDVIQEGYCSLNKNYEANDVINDFNIYYAISETLDKLKIKGGKENIQALDAAMTAKDSIVVKAATACHSICAQAALAGLINVIIAEYYHIENVDYMDIDSFKEYLENIVDTDNEKQEEYSKVMEAAYNVWSITLRSKNYEKPREYSVKLIEKFGKKSIGKELPSITKRTQNSINNEFDEWLTNWNFYSSQKYKVRIKLLMSALLLTDRVLSGEKKGYEGQRVTLKKQAFSYNLNGKKLELDHLEPNVITENDKRFFLYNDLEERSKKLNSYLGNFMILDKKPNSEKGAGPLVDSMDFYDKIKDSWMIRDIYEMIEVDDYFEKKRVPTEEFFKRRSEMLKSYFKAITESWLEDEISVNI